jgi:cytosine/adenosine deaminase-related metal-dependent hydrolase
MRISVSTWASDSVCPPDEPWFRRTRDTDAVLRRIDDLLTVCAGDQDGLVRARPTAVYGVMTSDELAAGLAELVARHDVPFATHVGALRNEYEASVAYYGATPVRRLADAGLLSERLTAVHSAHTDADERKLLVDAGAHINISPAKYGYTGETTLTGTGALPEYRRAGLDLSLSTDGTSVPLGGMAEAMRAAYQSFNEMSGDPTALRATAALAMATRIAAKGMGWADEVGSLEPGKRADLILVPTDDWRYLLNPRPLEAFLALGGSADVGTVVVGGRIVVSDGCPTGVDAEQLEADYLAAVGAFSVRCLGVDPDLVARWTGRSAGRKEVASR